MTPLELLKKQLKEYEHNLEKSVESFEKGDIDERLHLTHKINLEHRIKEYRSAIFALHVHAFYKNKKI